MAKGVKRILVLGAGRSSSTLIRNLLRFSVEEGYSVRVGDLDLALAQSKMEGFESAIASQGSAAFKLDAGDAAQRKSEISAADVVVSMLPASMHALVMADAIEAGCHAITPIRMRVSMAGTPFGNYRNSRIGISRNILRKFNAQL